MKRQHGAALAETFILMLVLTPIMFGVPMIGKLIDLRQNTVQASRYAAWQATVSNSATAPNDINDRFFSIAGVPLGGDASAPNALWGDTQDDDQTSELPEVEAQSLSNYWTPAHTEVRLDEQSGAALPYISAYDSGADGKAALEIQGMVEKAGDAAASVTGGEWMQSGSLKGMLRGEVQAQVQGNGWFDTLTFNDSTVIMYDNWSSRNDSQAADRSRAMVPAGALEPIGNMFAKVGAIPMLKELKNLDGRFGYVDMQPLPGGETPFGPDSRIERRELKQYVEPD